MYSPSQKSTTYFPVSTGLAISTCWVFVLAIIGYHVSVSKPGIASAVVAVKPLLRPTTGQRMNYLNSKDRGWKDDGSDCGHTDQDADLEPVTRNEPMATKTLPRFDSPVRIHFIHYRERLVDCDGPSRKAAIDGIVQRGILQDDSLKEIKTITEEQIKVGSRVEEHTVAIITDDEE